MSATKDTKHDKPATQQIIFFYISLELQTSQSLFNFVKKKASIVCNTGRETQQQHVKLLFRFSQPFSKV